MAFTALFHLLNLIALVSLMVSQATTNPFSPKASLLRYWKTNFPAASMPEILLNKASPLNATQLAVFSHYIDTHTLQNHILAFCAAGNLFCDMKSSANITHDAPGDSSFRVYGSHQFLRYQNGDDFRNYSVGQNTGRDTFKRYSQDLDGDIDQFSNYAVNTNVASSGFENYDKKANAMSSLYTSYGSDSNIQSHDFKSYGSQSSGTSQDFTSYSENSNIVANKFLSYGSDANAVSNSFTAYSTKSNVITNAFNSYDHAGNGGSEDFTNYSGDGNGARNDFLSYASDGNSVGAAFKNYADGANEPENKFQSYGRDTNSPYETFSNYGNSLKPSTDEFKEYGKDSAGVNRPSFSTYAENATFKEYFKSATNFQEYTNGTAGISSRRKFSVEPGKFFRQGDLVAGKKIPMPDIRDKMPARSFLPRVLADKLPFSTTKLPELVETLAASGLEAFMAKTISDCERPSVKDETKRCVTSIEGMTEFAASVLGKTAWVSTTANTNGSGSNLFVGKVVGRNNGKETRAVSCHQSLFPYLVYYCHMVPRVMVYDVELLDENSRKAANQGVAICHLDTTQWSATHAAFLSLGGKPGKIEVCHWIFENDLIWVSGN